MLEQTLSLIVLLKYKHKSGAEPTIINEAESEKPNE